ncbi:PilT/PilU family type 4a pilus ATPase [Candidatus Gottesmanbacteria bacterium]|nr:PilT/PilU family type 4a pilus ATPase [Candidatus Gottesmanbacteria bacterium]
MDSVKNLLALTSQKGASDLHLVVGYKPTLRIDGVLQPVSEAGVLAAEVTEKYVFEILSPDQKDIFLANREFDFSYSISGANFRVNVYFEKGSIALAARLIPEKIRTVEELGLPQICHQLTKLRQGFILVTGPTGHGKSTSLASMLNEINMARDAHIITIEDPIEYIYPKSKGLVSQREMRLDTHSWDGALRSALREDIDVVLIGEMRDFETIASALTIAETGHLVFATLHTNSSAQSIDRIVDVFPSVQQPQIRMQLAANLEAILSQRLLPKIGGGRIPAVEVLLGTSAVRSTIREGKSHLIDNIIQTSKDLGMETLEGSLATLVKEGKVSMEVASNYALKPEELFRLVK